MIKIKAFLQKKNPIKGIWSKFFTDQEIFVKSLNLFLNAAAKELHTYLK